MGSDTVDIHYTPSAVAKSLVQAARDLRPEFIADLAAGRGDLLFEAERVWPRATFVATDIDGRAIRRLARLRPSWIVGRCDLRNRQSRAGCRALKKVLNSACLLLLNPPFSCRGGTRFLVETSDDSIYASTAMSFLLLASKYAADRGHIISVLPFGCLNNLKDEQAWEYLRSKYNVQLLGTCERGTFPSSAASTALVRLSPYLMGTATVPSSLPAVSPKPKLRVCVIRGGCQLHRMRHEKQKPILVHYTDIRNGVVELNGRLGYGAYRCVEGPAILIPRVGRINTGKVALLETDQSVMLSDCVIALKPASLDHAHLLRERLTKNFTQLREHYVGTGAPFITLCRLRTALSTMGVEVDESC